jgi:CubicO group peptidase (beta-lactamase class C family)
MTEIDAAAVDALLTRAAREVDEGLLPSCQVALAKGGELVVDEAFGAATTDSRFTIFSATKAFVASVVWQLMGEGLLDPDQLVSELLPSFGTNGKDVITLDHVLQHTSGFPMAPLSGPEWDTHEGRAAAFSRWRLNWDVGSKYEYHPTSAHWVLAELIHAVTGEDHTDAVRTRVAEPLGLKAFTLGVAEEDQGDIQTLVPCGDPASPDELEAALGIRDIPVGEVTEEALLGLNAPRAKALGVPGGGAVSDAADLARFYQALLHNPKGVWDDDLLHDVTRNVRNTFRDPLLGHPIRRTLGLCTAGDDGFDAHRGFGRTGSAARFGHNGAGGQLAWADPESGLSFAYLTNGLDAHVIRQAKRGVALSSIAADCVK